MVQGNALVKKDDEITERKLVASKNLLVAPLAEFENIDLPMKQKQTTFYNFKLSICWVSGITLSNQ